MRTCGRCGSHDIVDDDGGVVNEPSPWELPDPNAEVKEYKDALRDAMRDDWRFFREKMDEVDDFTLHQLWPDVPAEKLDRYKKSDISNQIKELKRKIYDMWRDPDPTKGFSRLKYGRGGRKCTTSEFPNCKAIAYDVRNYPWRKEYVVEGWWEVNKPDWWPRDRTED